MDIRLQSFLKVWELKSFTKAAQNLNLTQPAVSQHIKSLEKEYNSRFLNYKGKDLILTDSGKILLEYANKIKLSEIFFIENIKQSSSKIKSIKFGATLTIGEFTLESILFEMFRNFDNYNLEIYVENTKKNLEMLEKGEIHFSLVEGLFDKTKYYFKVLKNEKFILTVSKDHNLATKSNIRIEDILNETLIIREKGSGSREILERALVDKNFNLKNFSQKIEISNVNLIKSLVKSNLGISFMYKDAAKKEIDAGELIEVKVEDFTIEKEFNFIYMDDELYIKELIYFYEFLKQNMIT
ncbi:DNA-binding transcriptional LysR family regulator [Acetoanaerobium pronyense]|uniref:DNA-binding transcriptional LysR family regulator n=1 Tax=Acetoanaerobium pronyense TaxID=1482736 RepID=A0ABS4KJB3_9FIRM|nr:LysR family transcriptional regulator [Acetoanaerobium pronyense]MBP2027883.1 DNA-binding transcriptional LysR family regulator [Acetoanaerobium pronyense]